MSSSLPPQVSITEHAETEIECPPKIGEQLEKAAFEQQSANVYVKRRETLGGNRSEYEVAKATVDGDTLQIEVNDVVGVVNLTPSSRLQISPKIGWEEVLEMFLTVLKRRDRSVEYQGIPIEDFLENDVGIEDIFLIAAMNFLESLTPIHEQGFIRELQTERRNAITSSGRIDIRQSLLNHHRGIPKQHYIEKKVEYSLPVHELIHAAGIQLLRLFDRYSDEYDHEGYYQVFSAVDREVQYLENLGVTSDFNLLSDYGSVSINDLPSQREYYRDAIEVSKMILSSATGRTIENGHHELTMDYILNMDELFQEYTQAILEDITAELLSDDLRYEAGIEIEDEPRIYAYENEGSCHHRPDHLIRRDKDTVAVLDTKYYAENIDPSLQTDSRTRMFSYAFLTNSNHLAFLTPLGKARKRPIATRDATLTVVSATQESDNFSAAAYENALKKYLKSVFVEELSEFEPAKKQYLKTDTEDKPEQNKTVDSGHSEQDTTGRIEHCTDPDLNLENVFHILESEGICHPNVEMTGLQNVQDIPSKLKLETHIQGLAEVIFKETTKRSNKILHHNSMGAQEKPFYRNEIKRTIESRKDCDFCLPVLVTEQNKEALIFYFISSSENRLKYIENLHFPRSK